MDYYPTRYAAFKAYPNAMIRKVLYSASHLTKHCGEYVAFTNYTTYEDWKRCGYVR